MKPRPLTERYLIYCTEKDETGRTPFVEHYRTGDTFTTLHGQVLDSEEDTVTQKALDESSEAAHKEILTSHANTVVELFENPHILSAKAA